MNGYQTRFVGGRSLLPEERESGEYFSARQHGGQTTEEQLRALRAKNNPTNEATGHFTGRCPFCGSDDLWDDNLAYGCNDCGAHLSGN